MRLGLRTAPKEDLQCSTAEMVYGQPLRIPGDFLPYRVLEHGGMHLVDLGGKAEHISVDRVKAVHLDFDQPVVLARPPRQGRLPAELGPAVPVPPLPAAAPAEVASPAPVLRSRGGRPVIPPRRTDFVYG